MSFPTTPGSALYCRQHARARGVDKGGRPLPEWPDLPDAMKSEFEAEAAKIQAEQPVDTPGPAKSEGESQPSPKKKSSRARRSAP